MAEPTQTPEQPEPAAPQNRASPPKTALPASTPKTAAKRTPTKRGKKKPPAPRPPRPPTLPFPKDLAVFLDADATMKDLVQAGVEAPTAGRVREVLEGISLGMSVRRACQAAGVAEPTYYDWRDRAEKGSVPHKAIVAAMTAAAARGERYRLTAMHTIGMGKAGKLATHAPYTWLLSRTNREDFGDKQQIAIVSPGDLNAKTNEELLLEIDRLKRDDG